MELDNKENNILWNCLISLKNEIKTLEQLNEKLYIELNKANKVLVGDIDFIKNKAYIHALNKAIVIFITEIDNYINWRSQDVC
jgi:hypothetical protein